MNVPIPHLDIKSKSVVAQLNTLEIVPVRTQGLDTPEEKDKPVLLVMHGMGCGFGVFNKNLDALAEEYHVFAIDILGFGGSSRVMFPKSQDGSAAENLFVEAIHAWKQQMGIQKLVVCGHSFGGYLATCFALRYPEEASALMLIDPWGFPEPDHENLLRKPFSSRMINQFLFGMIKPVTFLRCLGPLGPSTFARMRQHVVGSKHDASEREMMLSYLYHANAHARGTGAAAFQTLCLPSATAKRPLLSRFAALPPEIPVSFIYGESSWISARSGLLARSLRPPSAHTSVDTIQNAGHNVHLDQPAVFNAVVKNVAKNLKRLRVR